MLVSVWGTTLIGCLCGIEITFISLYLSQGHNISKSNRFGIYHNFVAAAQAHNKTTNDHNVIRDQISRLLILWFISFELFTDCKFQVSNSSISF
jgi:hypothetical protein